MLVGHSESRTFPTLSAARFWVRGMEATGWRLLGPITHSVSAWGRSLWAVTMELNNDQ